MFTSRTITHSFLADDGTAAAGQIRFSLSNRMTNSGQTVMPSQAITVQLDNTGAFSQSLVANDDALTTPTGSTWQVTISLTGAKSEQYFIVVPSAGSGNVDLGTLLPAQAQVE